MFNFMKQYTEIEKVVLENLSVEELVSELRKRGKFTEYQVLMDGELKYNIVNDEGNGAGSVESGEITGPATLWVLEGSQAFQYQRGQEMKNSL